MISGRFVFWPDTPRQLIVPNSLVDQGEESFLKMIARADVVDVPSGGNFFVGLSGASFAEDTTLATLTGEPTVTNGYARKPIIRSAAGWPTLGLVNGIWRIATGTIDFIAAGGNFSAAISRAFLCNVVSGSAGILFSVSGVLPAPKTIVNGETFPVRYELFVR